MWSSDDANRRATPLVGGSGGTGDAGLDRAQALSFSDGHGGSGRRANIAVATRCRGSMKLAGRSILIVAALPMFHAVVAGPLEDADAAFQRRDYATAYAVLRPLADYGAAAAQQTLGFMYANGQGVAQDYVEAVRLFRL